jgi:hypothetical protein
MNIRTACIPGAALAAAVVVGFSSVAAASASTSPSPSPSSTASGASLTNLKARCNAAVQRREGTLSADMSFVQQSKALSDSDRATLESQISADATGLTALDQKIQGDATYQQAHTDCQQIVLGYRVYVLEDPKIHEVIAADGVSDVNTMYETLIPQLQQLINASSKSQSVKMQAQTYLNDLRDKVHASENSISGVSASVLNLQPAGYPGNRVDLQSAAQNIATARTDLDGARGDVSTILTLLG